MSKPTTKQICESFQDCIERGDNIDIYQMCAVAWRIASDRWVARFYYFKACICFVFQTTMLSLMVYQFSQENVRLTLNGEHPNQQDMSQIGERYHLITKSIAFVASAWISVNVWSWLKNLEKQSLYRVEIRDFANCPVYVNHTFVAMGLLVNFFTLFVALIGNNIVIYFAQNAARGDPELRVSHENIRLTLNGEHPNQQDRSEIGERYHLITKCIAFVASVWISVNVWSWLRNLEQQSLYRIDIRDFRNCPVYVNHTFVAVGLLVNFFTLFIALIGNNIVIYFAENALEVILNCVAIFWLFEIDNQLIGPNDYQTMQQWLTDFIRRSENMRKSNHEDEMMKELENRCRFNCG
eukprot:CAMPEP_0197071988 /NCGR_PEP_ID=MMETSP1384-20130603/209871_1 /TAXON_ID=29189 /ORGANISM="Ammonia sp." /LENGTH=351 /DNA_ID=CAMNT_0042510801 /DNA_START=116 /DNA_END=1167 /DNA_ORIENTATION=-